MAQTDVDLLIQKINMPQDDDERLEKLFELCGRNDISTDTFHKYAFVTESLAAKTRDPLKMGLAAYYVAWAHYLDSYNDSARLVIDKALRNIDAADPEQATVYFKLMSFKATTYQSERNHTEALKILYPLLSHMQRGNNQLFIAQTMHLIAIVESQQNEPRKAIDWELQTLPLLDTLHSNDAVVLSTVYATLGKAYKQLKKMDSAAYYNMKAIEKFRRAADLYNLATALQLQANLYIEQKKIKETAGILRELASINENIHMGEGDMNYSLTFVNYYIAAGEYDKAIALAKGRLEKAGDEKSRSLTKWGIRLSYFEALAKCYKAKGDVKSYAAELERIVAAKDSFYAINSAESIANLQTRYEVEKKEKTIVEQKLLLTRKNVLMYGSVLLLISGICISWLLFRNYSRRQKMEMILLRQEEKIKGEQAVKDAEEGERKRIAADLHDNLGSYAASIASNVDHLERSGGDFVPLQELKSNSQAMVAMLSDTIWALKKDKLSLTAISDRTKVLLQRLRQSYPEFQLDVVENIEQDTLLPPSQAYHLFCIIHEAVNNALKHSKGNRVEVYIFSEATGQWMVQVKDNGNTTAQSINTGENGNGLFNMRQRAEISDWNIDWKSNEPVGIVVEVVSATTN
ncbi:MAG TPA: hypothetical protein VL098_09895 [Flavipsychrobacter sp.]|nr:hypothetical protein [Flavipsychrobacter sp.]